MSIFKRSNIKNILLTLMWLAITVSSVLLLAAGVHRRDKKLCTGLEINIRGVSNNFFIDKHDVQNIITSYAGDNITGTEIEAFNLVAMEAELKREVWIKNAELFFDNNGVLQASVEEREPVARLFSTDGNTFYIDNSCMVLPVSNKISARLPVFTGFASAPTSLTKQDSSLLLDIKKLSLQIQADSFLMAMIDQVDITPQRTFEMIPKIGDQLIVFGDASDAAKKFEKLRLFYKKVVIRYGWSRYSVINLQYKDQVIGKLKGRDDFSADSVRSIEIMHAIAINAARAASDSLQTIIQDNERNTTNVSLIEQSMERDDEFVDEINPFQKSEDEGIPAAVEKPVEKPAKPVVKPLVKPVVKAVPQAPKKAVNKETKPVKKPVQVKPLMNAVKSKPIQEKPAEKPKLIMPKKNDY